MPKLTNRVPLYRRHRQSGQGIVTLSGRDFLLGPYGTKASRAKYNRLVAEWLTGDRQPLVSTATDLSVADLAARYWDFASCYYVKMGRPTDEQGCIRSALRPLLRLYETESAARIGPLALVVVRDAMIECGWTRKTINKQIDRIRRMYRWGVEKQLISETSYRALKSVAALRKGRCNAREYDDVSGTFDANHEKGTVTRIDVGGIALRVPEQIFPKKIIPERIIPKQIIAKKIVAEHFVRAEWFELTEEWVDGKSDENWDDALWSI